MKTIQNTYINTYGTTKTNIKWVCAQILSIEWVYKGVCIGVGCCVGGSTACAGAETGAQPSTPES